MSQNKNLTILSLNAWRGTLRDELVAYITDKKDVVDIFCFQEANSEARVAFDELLLSGFTAHYATKNIGDEHYAQATYVRRGISVVRTASIFEDSQDNGLALINTLQVMPDLQLTIVNVHGEPRPGDKLDTPSRLQQSRGIIDALQQIANPRVIIGDFNLDPETESVGMFAAHGYRNLISEFEIPTTRNEAAWERFPESKQLYADYAFTHTDRSYDLDFSVEDNLVSDHLPLILTLSHKVGEMPAALSRVNMSATFTHTA